MSARRVLTIARLTLLEMLRQRILWLWAALAAVLIATSRGMLWVNFGLPQGQFVMELGLGLATFAGVVLAALGTAQICERDFESGLLALLLTRGVTRAEYWFGRFAGALAVLGLVLGLLTAVLHGALLGLGTGLQPLAARAVAFVWLKCGVIAAISMALAATTRSLLLAQALTVLLVVAGHLHGISDAAGRWLAFVPDFARLGPEALVSPTANLLYGAAMMALWCAVGWLIFRRREI